MQKPRASLRLIVSSFGLPKLCFEFLYATILFAWRHHFIAASDKSTFAANLTLTSPVGCWKGRRPQNGLPLNKGVLVAKLERTPSPKELALEQRRLDGQVGEDALSKRACPGISLVFLEVFFSNRKILLTRPFEKLARRKSL